MGAVVCFRRIKHDSGADHWQDVLVGSILGLFIGSSYSRKKLRSNQRLCSLGIISDILPLATVYTGR